MTHEPIKASTIAEAAKLLGVSKRTVYRRLNKGRLTRVKKGDTWIGDVSPIAPSIRDNEIKDGQDSNVTLQVDGAKDDKINTNHDICTTDANAERDEIIRRLETDNQELRQLVRQLQDQMYELAKQTVTQAIQTQPLQPNQPASRPQRSLFASFFASFFTRKR